MRSLLFSFTLLIVLSSFGCAGYYLGDYRMAGTAWDKKEAAVYEDDDIKVVIAILEDRKFGLQIQNKTRHPLRITWGNSCIRDGSGREVKLMHRLTGGSGVDGPGEITRLDAGGSADAEVYPAGHVYKDRKGRERVRPLYDTGPGHDSPYDLKGRTIGINLVAEVNDHARLYPLMLEVRPARNIVFW